MSSIYFSGQGVPKDIARAKLWAELAMRTGYDLAKPRHDAILAQMSPSELAKSQTMMKHCLDTQLLECG